MCFVYVKVFNERPILVWHYTERGSWVVVHSPYPWPLFLWLDPPSHYVTDLVPISSLFFLLLFDYFLSLSLSFYSLGSRSQLISQLPSSPPNAIVSSLSPSHALNFKDVGVGGLNVLSFQSWPCSFCINELKFQTSQN